MNRVECAPHNTHAFAFFVLFAAVGNTAIAGAKGQFEALFKKYFGEWFILLSREDVYRTGIFGRGVRSPKFDDLIGDYVACAISDRNLVYRIVGGSDDTLVGKHAGLTGDEMLVPVIIDRR